MNHNRKEPVLEGALEENEDAPLLLTNMVREGLPPPLWRHEESMESTKLHSQQPVETLDNKPASTEKTFSMQWEEARSTSAATATDPASTPRYTQSSAYLQNPEISKAPKDFEDNDLEAALARMREGLSQYTASRHETTADEKLNTDIEPDGPGIVSDRLKPAPDNHESSSPISTDNRELGPIHADNGDTAAMPVFTRIDPETTHPITDESESTPPAESVRSQHDEPIHKEPIQEPVEISHSTEHFTQEPALEKTVFDLDFLKDFEQLLFQEIERRVMNEMEEQMIEHLQKIWKEQLSLTMMRTLALEGIKLRESLAQEMRKSLPEILQRVLHNGLEQIIPTETD